MKHIYIVFGVIVIILGVLLAMGPQLLFKPCTMADMAEADSCGDDGCSDSVSASDCCDSEEIDHEHIAEIPLILGACGGSCELSCVCGNSGTCSSEGCGTLDGICGENKSGGEMKAAASSGCGGCGSGGGGGCGTTLADLPVCFWTAQAILGLGFLIIALGLCIIVFSDPRTNVGLSIGTFFAGIVAVFIPNSLMTGCTINSMPCRTTTFPAITVISIVLIVLSALYVVYLERKNKASA